MRGCKRRRPAPHPVWNCPKVAQNRVETASPGLFHTHPAAGRRRPVTCLALGRLIDYALLVVGPACFARAESRSSFESGLVLSSTPSELTSPPAVGMTFRPILEEEKRVWDDGFTWETCRTAPEKR